MKKSLTAALVLVIVFGCAGVPNGKSLDMGALEEITSKFPFAILVGSEQDDDLKFLYADKQSHIHVYRVNGGKLELDWDNTTVGSLVSSMFVTDLYGDGLQKLVVGTAGGRILIYDMDGYDLEWENHQDAFDQIAYMIAENLDDDPQKELVFIADRMMYIYDSVKKTIEWQSQDEFNAAQIITGDVDDDDQLEIILNTGIIIDSRFYNIEFQTDDVFGDRIFLMDINGDGIPEIVGEFTDYNLRIFDVYAEREIW